MKLSIAIALLFCLFTLRLQAQQKVVEKTMTVPANKKIDLNITFGDNIKITAWDKKEASIKMTYAVNGGRLNDALQVTFNAENGVARIDVKFDQEMLKTGKAADCPADRSGNRYYNGDGTEIYTCHQIEYEVFVPRDADLNVTSVHCNIELIGLTGPVQAKAIHGFVDMNWPSKKGAAFTFRSAHGDVFSDMDIKFSGEKDQHHVTGTLNGGGTNINLEAVHSNVYFRRQK
jgi:hypothetical protein